MADDGSKQEEQESAPEVEMTSPVPDAAADDDDSQGRPRANTTHGHRRKSLDAMALDDATLAQIPTRLSTVADYVLNVPLRTKWMGRNAFLWGLAVCWVPPVIALFGYFGQMEAGDRVLQVFLATLLHTLAILVAVHPLDSLSQRRFVWRDWMLGPEARERMAGSLELMWSINLAGFVVLLIAAALIEDVPDMDPLELGWRRHRWDHTDDDADLDDLRAEWASCEHAEVWRDDFPRWDDEKTYNCCVTFREPEGPLCGDLVDAYWDQQQIVWGGETSLFLGWVSGICFLMPLVATAWRVEKAWTAEAFEQSARRLFDAKFFAIFQSIEAQAAKIGDDPRADMRRPAMGAAAVVVLYALVADWYVNAPNPIHDSVVETMEDGLDARYPGPYFAAAIREPSTFIIALFIQLLHSAVCLTAIYQVGLKYAIARQQRNWLRMHLIGELIDCTGETRHDELVQVEDDEEAAALLQPSVSVSVPSDLAQWVRLRTFVRHTTIQRDHHMSEWVVKFIAGLAVLGVLYLAITLVLSGTLGIRFWGFVIVAFATPVMSITLSLVSTAAGIMSFREEHVTKLRNNQSHIRIEVLALSAAPSENEDAITELTAACDAIEDVITHVTETDEAPKIAGVPITPGFQTVLFGYFASGCIAIVSSIVLG